MTDSRDDGSERPGTPSDRAVAWLGALRRERPVSLLRVHRALDEAGVPAFEPWLEFHDRYAGYAVLSHCPSTRQRPPSYSPTRRTTSSSDGSTRAPSARLRTVLTISPSRRVTR